MNEYWDDETLCTIAEAFGKPKPHCKDLRNQIKQKIKVSKVGSHITTDGEKVFVFKNNKESLRFAFRQNEKY